jgi:6-pyruvoyltetrahydropterin/6-carboxytetrahydropterin synthase
MDGTITRQVEFDAAHRIPFHDSKCHNNHGHRYVVVATVSGPIQSVHGRSDDGMVLDFGKLKELLVECVVEPWDHATLAWEQDTAYIDALLAMGTRPQKLVRLAEPPTAENLAVEVFNRLEARLSKDFSPWQKVTLVRVYETPNCWADFAG